MAGTRITDMIIAMDGLGFLILGVVFAYCYRARGNGMFDGWPHSTFLGRVVCWALPVSFILTALTGDIWMLLAWLPLWCGVFPGYFGGKFDLTLLENRTWRNYLSLTARGMWICTPLALCFGLWYPGLFFGVVAGSLFVPCYLLGTVLIKYIKIPLVGSASQWGEWTLGFCIGSALCLADFIQGVN
jgi:hypothetical protein